MVSIIPFRGLRYNMDKVKLRDVVAPPYDIISAEEQDEYYKTHQWNVIRLILGKELLGDNSQSNKYTRAAAYLSSWLEQGVLVRDEEPSIYVYEEEYEHLNEKRVMRGFIALAGLEELGKGSVLPHEETLRAPVKDRLSLRRACRANFSSIFTVYSEPSGAVENALDKGRDQEPVADVTAEGVRHRLWRIKDPEIIEKVVAGMRDKRVLIADGHHRYETALTFWRETGEDRHGYVLMYFTNMDHSGITILPAHRLVRLEDYDLEGTLAGLRRYFGVQELPPGDKAFNNLLKRMKEPKAEHVFGLYSGGKYYFLTLFDEGVLDEIGDKGKSKEWRRLDVSIVHSLVLKHVLGIAADGEDVAYITDAEEAVEQVKKGHYQLLIFLNPTKLVDVRKIALKGEKMPGKATYFYPKLLTGLVMNKMD